MPVSQREWKRLFDRRIRRQSQREWKHLHTKLVRHATLGHWERACVGSAFKPYSVNLKNCGTRGRVIAAVGQILRTDDSTPISESSVLGGLADVTYDFFYENWGSKKAISLLGFTETVNLDSEFAIKLIIALQFSFLSSVDMRSRLEPDSDVAQEIEDTQIWIVWN